MKLLALYCPTCRDPLDAGNDDVLLWCAGCGAAAHLGDDGPAPATVYYVAGEDGDQQWLPFWVFSGRVHLTRRETQGGGRAAREEAEALWGLPRRLYVPAWQLNLHDSLAIGGRLIQQQPRLDFGEQPENGALVRATVAPADARKLLEFIILAIEARRSDWLKQLDFELALDEPELWAIPHHLAGP